MKMENENEEVCFRGYIASTSTALRFDGAGGGARVLIDIPENQLVDALPLIGMRESTLEIRIRVLRE